VREDGPVTVDVTNTIEVFRPRNEVASYAMNPSNATAWYKNIKSVELKTTGLLGIGSKVAFHAHFLGRSLSYVYEVIELDPGRRLVMRTADGPFPMETTYQFGDVEDGGTEMTLRNRGEPDGFSRLVAPFMAPAMRRANRKDLKRLKAVIESTPPHPA
jgi:uncharacterized membrane protein